MRRALSSAFRASAAGVLAVVLVSGCDTDELARAAHAEGIDPAAVVRLGDDFAVAARRGRRQVELVSFTLAAGGLWTSQVIGAHVANGEDSGSLSGHTGTAWNTYFYGSAGDNVSRVEVARPDTIGGQVIDGGWVVVMRAEDVPPGFEWRFVDAAVAIVRTGTGPFPPVE